MDSPQIIRDIAAERLTEAKVLAKASHFNGAFYLAGYAIELHLKARICEHFDMPDLYSEDQKILANEKGFGEIRRALKTHNLLHLLRLSGLWSKFERDKAIHQELFDANSLLFENWNELYRYKPCGYCKPGDVEALIEALEDKKTGLVQWILNN